MPLQPKALAMTKVTNKGYEATVEAEGVMVRCNVIGVTDPRTKQAPFEIVFHSTCSEEMIQHLHKLKEATTIKIPLWVEGREYDDSNEATN